MTGRKDMILIVDYEVINLRMLERLLRAEYGIFTAASGAAALEILSRGEISLLISEQRMPGFTGVELFLAGRRFNPNLTCMLVRATTDDEAAISAMFEAGAFRVIDKPWDPLTLRQFVLEAMAKRETLIEESLIRQRSRVETECDRRANINS